MDTGTAVSSKTYYLVSAIGSGLLLALSWPSIGGLTPLIFLAWVPLLLAEDRFASASIHDRPRHFMPFVMLALAVWNLLTTWWLGAVSEPLGTRAFTLIGPNIGNVLVMSVPWALMRFARRARAGRTARWTWVVFWMAFEYFHLDWDLSWPWLTLGNVFANDVEWVQWYEITGVAGGSLWVLVVNVGLTGAILDRMRGAGMALWRRRITAWALVMLVPILGSWWRYGTYTPDGKPLDVVVVQPNLDPYKDKFGDVDPLEQLRRMLALAEAEMTSGVQLVVLPETALQEPFTLGHDGHGPTLHGLWENDLAASRSVAAIRAFQTAHPEVTVLAGMSSGYLFPPGADLPVTARPLEGLDRGFDAYNAALLVRPDGSLEVYHKSKLVPGAELMPFENVLGSLGALALDLGGTTGSLGTQEEREVMRVPATGLALAPVICYESIYADHVAAHVRNGASAIIIMTNDGWWADSPGYRHHLAYGRLRAIENRRSIARSANTGISCFIGQRGDVLHPAGWWVPDAIKGTLLASERSTFFTRHGDLLGRASWYGAGLVLLLLVVNALRTPSKR